MIYLIQLHKFSIVYKWISKSYFRKAFFGLMEEGEGCRNVLNKISNKVYDPQ